MTNFLKCTRSNVPHGVIDHIFRESVDGLIKHRNFLCKKKKKMFIINGLQSKKSTAKWIEAAAVAGKQNNDSSTVTEAWCASILLKLRLRKSCSHCCEARLEPSWLQIFAANMGALVPLSALLRNALCLFNVGVAAVIHEKWKLTW